MIAFRVDANASVATGHMMRCMAIAQGVRRTGDGVLFLTADETGAAFARARGFQTVCLHADWSVMESELPALKEIVASAQADCLVVDSYQATPGYLRALRAMTRTLYIDDLNRYLCPADAVLNYNLYASKRAYEARYRQTGTRLLLGPAYAPLREEFEYVTPVWRETPRAVLITLGGSDTAGMGRALARSLCARLEGVTIDLVQGVYTANEEWPQEERSCVRLHRNVAGMAELMTACDLAVTAGGSTLYELCACGIPAVSCSVADNQLKNVRAFDTLGLIDYCGDVRDGREECVRRLTEKTAELFVCPPLRKTRSRRLRRVVDGRGAFRIVHAIGQLCGKI